MASKDEESFSTTVHISNLHCASCVKTVDSCMLALSPSPLSVEVSLDLKIVTVNHLRHLRQGTIRRALRNAGFEVAFQHGTISPVFTGLSSFLFGQRKKHFDQCVHCQSQEKSLEVLDTPESSGDLASSKSSLEGECPITVTLSVGGMTCIACVNTITEKVSQIPGVSDVAVNLLGGSVKAVVRSNSLASFVCETIEDCGFEAQVVDASPVHNGNQEHEMSRNVSLRIDGMFCQNCPQKVMTAIGTLGKSVTVMKPLTSIKDPILTVSYRPSLPDLSIRTITAAITVASSPSFKVTIYHPPTIEELSRRMQFREQRRLLYRLLFAFIAAIPTFIIGIVYMTLVKDGNPARDYIMQPIWSGNVSRGEWSLFFIATPVMFYSANTFHRKSIQEIRALWRTGTSYSKRFVRFGSMNLLVSLGVSVAYFSSVGLLGLEARSPRRETGDPTTYFDTSVFLAMFLLAGRCLQAYSRARTADAISALNLLRPTDALLLTSATPGGSVTTLTAAEGSDLEKGDTETDQDDLFVPLDANIQTISIDYLEVGDIVRVRSGSSPPTDGIVMPGQHGIFDESSLTGESRLIKKNPGDKVFVGTINKGQVLHLKVDAIGGGTMLDKIVQVVREGQSRRAPIERVADLITGYFVPVITLLAIVTWVVWLALGLTGTLPSDFLDIDIGGWPVWSLQFAIAVFVVACPCGIGLAAPTALLVGLGLAAKCGILARGGGESFQEMTQLDLIVFDKTGTLTEGGEPRVSNCEIPASSPWSQSTLFGVAVELESISSHPLAIAIRHFCKDSDRQTGTTFEEIPGRGIKATFPGLSCTAIIGNENWMLEHGAEIGDSLLQYLESWKVEAKSVVLLAMQDEENGVFSIAAMFAITDSLRPEAAGVISQLHKQGIHTWVISGDNFTTASAVAAAVGIPAANVIAGVLPHEKSQWIQNLQKQGPKRNTSSKKRFWSKSTVNRTIVAMVGDGINDAPALAVADVGIAMGSGSDIALSSAGFVLLSSDLRSLITLRDLSSRIINRIKFNFAWAIVYNMIGVPVAAGVIYPAGHVRLSPVWASLAMALSSVSVVCSSLLLRFYKEPARSS